MNRTSSSAAQSSETQPPFEAGLVSEKEKATEQINFEQLFLQYAPYVLHVLPYLGVAKADVEDLCQDTFITVHDKLEQFEGRSSLRTWIYGICLRKAQNYRKRAFRRYETAYEQITVEDIEELQDQKLEHRMACEGLLNALDSLNDKLREVFVLFEIEQLSMKEIAQSLNCPIFTAYSRLYAARREVKRAVQRFSVVSESSGR